MCRWIQTHDAGVLTTCTVITGDKEMYRQENIFIWLLSHNTPAREKENTWKK